MPIQVNVHEAKSQLSKLIEAALRGEQVTIARAGRGGGPRAAPDPAGGVRRTGVGGAGARPRRVRRDRRGHPGHVLRGGPLSALLLDTNALLWVLQDSDRLGPGARDAIRAASRAHFSPVSVVEVETKVLLGRLEVPGDVAAAALSAGLVELPLASPHAHALAALPELARHDPFDRMLLAQAVSESMTLLTSDRTLLTLGRADVRSALE